MVTENDMNFAPDDGRGVMIRGTQDTIDYLRELGQVDEGEDLEFVNSSALAGHITGRFQKFSDAKETSGVEEGLFSDHRAYIGEYDSADLARIPDYGSSIYMNLTATKCRAGMSWIRDVLLQAKGERFHITSTPVPSLPLKTIRQITEYFEAELERGTQEVQEPQEQGATPQKPPAQQPTEGAGKVVSAAEKIRKVNELKREIEDSLYDEIQAQSNHELQVVERVIKDDLVAGDWDDALNEFITDFCIYSTAFMKAPLITKEEKLTWVNGEPMVADSFIYKNKRVSPFDMYPDPGTDNTDRGDVCEHLRLSRSEVDSLKGTPYYKTDIIKEVLELGPQGAGWLDSGIEAERAELENKGTEFDMNEDIFHGIHFHGHVEGQLLLDWGIESEKVDEEDPTKIYDIDAVLINHEVVKCVLNDDPLKRRPYLHASFQSIPGSIWGRSIPNLMKDVQRMCNACARALADNMGLSSGPQVEVYIDRLADSGAITAMEPRKIWQLKSDPTGAGGRAIQWFTIPSNAQELLAVYQDFEMKADDATGIPRYAYGNEKSAGAAQTARGLAMLLESASKGIRDAIRNIDKGVIIPRVEHQFYYTMITRKDLKYSGDIDIMTYASEAIILKAAQEAKRAEFLQITANPMDQEIMGMAGRADILREAAKELGFPHNLIPNKIELKKLEKEKREMEKQKMELEAQKQSTGEKIVQIQSASNEKIAQGNQALDKERNMLKQTELQAKHQGKLIELKEMKESVLAKGQQDFAKTAYKENQQNLRTNKQLAVDIARTKAVADSYTQRTFK